MAVPHYPAPLPLPFAPTLDSHPLPPYSLDSLRRPLSPPSPPLPAASFGLPPPSRHRSSRPPSLNSLSLLDHPRGAAATSSYAHTHGHGHEQTLGPTFSDEEDGDDSLFIAEKMAALGLDPRGVFGESHQAQQYSFQIHSMAQAKSRTHAPPPHTQSMLQLRSAQNDYHLYQQSTKHSQSHSHSQHSQPTYHQHHNYHQQQQYQPSHSQHQRKHHHYKHDPAMAPTPADSEREYYQRAFEQRQLEQLQAQQIIAQQFAQLQIQQQALAHLSAGLIPLNRAGPTPTIQAGARSMFVQQDAPSLARRKTDDADIRARFENAMSLSHQRLEAKLPSADSTFPQTQAPRRLSTTLTISTSAQDGLPSTQTRPSPFRLASSTSAATTETSPVLGSSNPLVALLSRRRADDGSGSTSTAASVSSTSSPSPTTPSPPAIEHRDPFRPILGLGYGRPSTLPQVPDARALTSPQISITPAADEAAPAAGFTVPGKLREEKEASPASGSIGKSVHVVRQPLGPPSSTTEMGSKNFASRLRRQAGLNLGMLGRRVESTPAGL